MIKGTFGDFIRSKRGSVEINEVLEKNLCYNVCVLCQATHGLGIDPTFHAAS
jgi:hypothetical protein